jgi:hypothetical protein
MYCISKAFTFILILKIGGASEILETSCRKRRQKNPEIFCKTLFLTNRNGGPIREL